MASHLAPGILLPGEWVQVRAGLHRAVYYPPLVIAALWLMIFVWAAATNLWLVALLAAGVMGILVPLLLLWVYLRRRRLIALEGPFPRRVSSLALSSIDHLHVRQGRGVVGFRIGAAASIYAMPFSDADKAPLQMHDLAEAGTFADAVKAALAQA